MPSDRSRPTSPGDAPLLQSDPWSWWRQQMPVAKRWSYLDHAAVGPLSAPAVESMAEYAKQCSSDGDVHWPKWNARLGELRHLAADWLGADRDEICLVPNTSTGINLVAEGFPWKPGDNVVIPAGEFPSNHYPWENQQTRGVELRIVPNNGGVIDLDDLFEHVDQSTRIIATSWVGYASGFRIDLADLVDRAHERGVLVFLDAIQGLGMFDLDLNAIDVDFLAADGHKWLLGPEGFGVAMIRKRHLDLLRCGNVGWNSTQQAFSYDSPNLVLRNSAVRFEPGSGNMVGAAALLASWKIFQAVRESHGSHAIGERVVALANELNRRLQTAGVITRFPKSLEHQSGIVTFEVPGIEPAAIRNAAAKQNCVVSCRGGGVRASIHAYNDVADFQPLLDAIDDARRAS